MKALIVVDMLVDFVDGALASPRAQRSQHTHICVRHTSYGALIRGYEITVPSDAVCAFEGLDEAAALDYLGSVYGARITTAGELIAAA